MEPVTGALIAGSALKLGGDLLSAKAERKSAKARAAAMGERKKRILQQGDQQAQSIIAQGQMDQTTLAAHQLSSGSMDRTTLAQDSSLQEIVNRAQNEAVMARRNAEYEALVVSQDIGALEQNIKDSKKAAYFNTASTATSILGRLYGDQYAASRQT